MVDLQPRNQLLGEDLEVVAPAAKARLIALKGDLHQRRLAFCIIDAAAAARHDVIGKDQVT